MKFQKGRSGNPAGRPKKGQALTELLREKLEETPGGTLTRKEKIVEKLIKLAEGGNLLAAKYIFDRIDGRPIESLRVGSGDIDGRLLEVLKFE